MLNKEFEWYKKHQEELLKSYNGKVLAIKNQKVLGAFDDYLDAYDEISKNHEVGTFLLQECTPGVEAYTQSFHTRAIF